MRGKVLLFALASAIASPVFAHGEGDWFVRAGLANVSPGSGSDGIAVPALSVPPIAGTEASADSNTQLGLTVNYMFTNKIGVELLASTPFSHDVTADLNGYSAGLSVFAGDTKQLPPTISAVYYPMGDTGNAFQPYVGLGLNLTIFFSEEASADLEALTGTLAGASGPVPLEMKLDNSVGVAAQAGFDYTLQDKWFVNAAVRYIKIETKGTFTSALGETITVDNVSIDPLVYQLTVGYSF